MEEEWKDIKGTNGLYRISNKGRVYSVRKNKCLCASMVSNGYLSVQIFNKTRYIHRLIAEAFIPNPENKPFIDHIDRNILNNSIYNLRWATVRENNLNRDPRKRYNKNSRIIYAYTLDGNCVGAFANSHIAEKAINGNHRHIIECCQKRRNHASGFVWRYDYDEFSFEPKSPKVKNNLLLKYKNNSMLYYIINKD